MAIVCKPEFIRSGRPRSIEPKKAFDYWMEYGTLKKATLALEREGHVKPNGIPYTSQGIQRAAWMWVIENPDESLKVWQEHGHFLNGRDDVWKEWISKKIRKFIHPNKRLDYILELNGVKDWYYERYGKRNTKSK